LELVEVVFEDRFLERHGRHMQRGTWVLVVLSYLVFAELLSWMPVSNLSTCLIQPTPSSETADYDTPKYCPAFHAGIEILLAKTDRFLEAHDKSVVGGFTIVLAISTIGLWLATNKLWEAGERQLTLLAETSAEQSKDMQASIAAANRSARAAESALTELERPYVFILDYNWLLINHDKANGQAGWMYVVANGGKLPAFIKRVSMGFSFRGVIPPLEDRPPVHELLTAPLIAAGERREVIQGLVLESGDTVLEYEIRGGMAFIPGRVLAGGQVIAKMLIEYDGPVTGDHITTACWEWHPGKHAFTQYGGIEHNQRT
jgi:hypothetical protein